MEYVTPPEGYQDLVPSAPPASSARPRGSLDLATLVDHAAQPLEDALAGPRSAQTHEALLMCIRSALARIRAIR